MTGRRAISVIGNIGSGKSTFLRRLNDCGFPTTPEPVRDWKFLSKFYEDSKRWAFALQIEVMNSFMSTESTGFAERSAWESYEIFCKNAYNNGHLDEDEFELLGKIAKCVNDKPKLMIYLQTTPSTCYTRMQKRNRPCEKAVTIEYINKLHDLYEKCVSDIKKSDDTTVITLNGELSEKVIVEDLWKVWQEKTHLNV